MDNKELITNYPFLIPRDVLTHEVVDGYNLENPDHTELNQMPEGWRKAFGEQMCEEIKQALLKANVDLNDYHINQIKEKYGELRWYDQGGTEEVYNIIRKYEDISRRTCLACGKPATKISTGWISPWCDECAEQIFDNLMPIEEFYK